MSLSKKEFQKEENGEVKAPKSILNSSRKARPIYTPKKSVAFRPPIAAEYNIGSPSMSMIPMCDKRTRSLYKVPSSDDNIDYSPSVGSDNNEEQIQENLSTEEDDSDKANHEEGGNNCGFGEELSDDTTGH